MLTERQKLILKYIVQEYIATANPVGSKTIIEKYMPDISAATVRNEMAVLEHHNYLEKNHTSSGRVPSSDGYKLYEREFSTPSIDDNLKMRLKKVFSNRSNSIDTIIDESCRIIQEVTRLPLVTIDKSANLSLKRVDLVQINEGNAIIMLILSNGDIVKNLIKIENASILKDISICVRIFNDRLVDCPLSELDIRLNLIKTIIRDKVQSYEFVMQEVVERIFNSKSDTFRQQSKITKNIIGSSSLLALPEFNDHKKLEEVLLLLENSTIWEQIALKQEQNGHTTSITFGDEFGHNDILFASTDIVLNNDNQTQLVMVSPTRVDYSKIKGLLEFIRDEFEKSWKK